MKTYFKISNFEIMKFPKKTWVYAEKSTNLFEQHTDIECRYI